jgi:hypothetical protein
MSTKASRISNTGRKWINQSATKGNNMKYPQDKTKRDKDNKSNRLEWCGPRVAVAGSSHTVMVAVVVVMMVWKSNGGEEYRCVLRKEGLSECTALYGSWRLSKEGKARLSRRRQDVAGR